MCTRCPSETPHRYKQDCIDYLNARVTALEKVVANEELTPWDAIAHPAAEERYRMRQAMGRVLPGDPMLECGE